MRLLLLLAAAAPLFGQTCSYSYSPDVNQPISIKADPSTNPITVTAPDICAWRYTTDASWISFVGGGSQNTGTVTLQWSAAPNVNPASRQGHITISSLFSVAVYTVVQDAPTCTLTLTPASATIPVAGGAGSVQVQTNCVWAVTGAPTWIGFTSPTSGTLGSTISYAAAANTCQDPRSAALSVQAGGAFGVGRQQSIQQDGAPGNLTLAPTGMTDVAFAGTDGTITVTTGALCPWIAYSEVSWISLTGASSGTGNGTVKYHIATNTAVARSGIIHVQGTTFTVTQQSAPPPPVQLNSVLNGASYAQGAIAPGEVVAVFGANLGPAAGVGPPAGSFPKTLSGVQLLFDGVAAPLLYVSATQVNAVAPYDLTSSSTQVQVQYQGSNSNSLAVPVQAAAPGLLSLDRTGIGPGAILNQDYSVNAVASPAARGSTVMIYCVGGGVTDPPSVDGSIVDLPTPRLTQPVLVTIGGVKAEVTYSGAVYQSIAGLTQINAVVPLSVTPGANVPVILHIGTFQSQTTVTMAVQ